MLRIDCKQFDPYTYVNDIALLHIDVSGGEPVTAAQQVALPPSGRTAPVAPVVIDGARPAVSCQLPGGVAGGAAAAAAAANDAMADDARRFDRCYLIGYGSTQLHGDPTLRLLIGPSGRISMAQCAALLGKYMAPEPHTAMFCAQGVGGDGRPVDTCQGDSGGPFLCRRRADRRYEVVGLTSYGAGCGAPNTPGVYTSMRGHEEWVRGIIDGAAHAIN